MTPVTIHRRCQRASYRKAMADAGMDPDNPPEPSAEEKERKNGY